MKSVDVSPEKLSRFGILKNFPRLRRPPLILNAIPLTILLVYLLGCAAQGPPGGGPVDKTGPVLIESIPQSGATGVEQRLTVSLRFSEVINPRSVEGNLIVVPRPERQPIIKTRRKTISIEFAEALRDDCTYILTFGRALKDYRGNATAENITLAFATGDSLDEGEIAGQVFGKPAKQYVQVWAYQIKDALPDTLPAGGPDFLTEADDDGNYRLTNLPAGRFRLIAVSAQTRRMVRIMKDYLIGLPPIDPLVLTQRTARIPGLNFQVMEMPKDPFSLRLLKSVENRLELFFTHPVREESLSRARFYLNGEPISPNPIVWLCDTELQKIYLERLNLTAEEMYQLSADSLYDHYDNLITRENQPLEIQWRSEVDTTQPAVARTLPNSGARDVAPKPRLRIDFTEPVVLPDIGRPLRLQMDDSSEVPLTYRWIDANSIELEPERPLESNRNYRLFAVSQKWTDLSGNFFADSAFTLRFQTVDINSFGSISGSIQPRRRLDLHALVIEALSKDGKIRKTVRPDMYGNYRLENLLPGEYRFQIWEDRNGNNRWDPGSLVPFKTAEPFRAYSQTINVRARWETAEVEWVY